MNRAADALTRPDIKHGLCTRCSRRRVLHRPVNLCERCLLATPEGLSLVAHMAATGGVSTPEQLRTLRKLADGLVGFGRLA